MVECNGSGKGHWTTQKKTTYGPRLCKNDKELVRVITWLHRDMSLKTNVTYRNIIDAMAETTFYKVMNNLSLCVSGQ